MLGIWLYDHSEGFRSKYVEFNQLDNKTSDDKWEVQKTFSHQWIYSSLLHDIGYISNYLPSNNEIESHLSLIDKYFNLDYLETIFTAFPEAYLAEIKRKAEFEIQLWKDNGSFPQYGNIQGPMDALCELDKAPWLSTLYKNNQVNTITSWYEFYTSKKGIALSPEITFINDYAKEIAQNGYTPGGMPTVDHAYASGNLILQFTSFKFWLINTFGKEIIEKVENENNDISISGFRFSIDYLLEVILPACHSASAHNILDSVNLSKEVLPFDIDKNPLLFLSVLCDELQKWHRAPVGSDYSEDAKKYNPPFEKEIRLSIGAAELDDRYYYDLDYRPIYKCISEDKSLDKSLKIVDTLNKRLNREDREKIIRIWQGDFHYAKYRASKKIRDLLK